MNRFFKKGIALIAMCISTSAIAQTLTPQGTWIKPSDEHIQYVGRISFKNPDSPAFTYPGIQINARFEGTSLKMVAKPMSGYFMAQIDKGEPFKVGFNAPLDSVVTLATALPDGIHEVKLMYTIEGYQRKPEFRGFLLDNGKQLVPPTALPERKIEFIGNSITCGYGIESINPRNGYMDETENHYYTYAARTARALNAQHFAVARSGIGIYRNYAGPKSGNDNCMPKEYAYTQLYDHTEAWDFLRYVPDVVCVNLGTNDTSTEPYDYKLLEDGYRQFLKKLRGCYPKAKIVYLTGTMMSGKALEDVKKALDKVVGEANKAGDKEVYRFDMTPQNGDLGIGADYHPSLWQQEKMAGELTAYLRSLMNWF